MQHSRFKAGGSDLQRLLAVEIDVQCALALSRSALRAVASLSAEAEAAVETCLDEEMQLAEMEDSTSARIIVGMIQEMRDQLRRSREEIERTRELEDILIRAAMTLSSDPDEAEPD
jgi:hypothetical protein